MLNLGYATVISLSLALAGTAAHGDVASPGQTSIVSLKDNDYQINDWIDYASVSDDGRYVAFATGIAAAFEDGNDNADVYVRDRELARTILVSVGNNGFAVEDGDSGTPAISADGRFVVFMSTALGLEPNTEHIRVNKYLIYVRDMLAGTTKLITRSVKGNPIPNGSSENPSISADGRYIVYTSFASDLVSSDTNKTFDVFWYDRLTGVTRLVSRNTSGVQGNKASYDASVSDDGMRVGFSSTSTNLVANDTNNGGDVFVRDRSIPQTIRATAVNGSQFARGNWSPQLSADGSTLAFIHQEPDVSSSSVYAFDVDEGRTELVSVGMKGEFSIGYEPLSISRDGRFISFISDAHDLTLMGHIPSGYQAYVRDRALGRNEMISVDRFGQPGDDWTNNANISPSGRFVAFSSLSNNLVAGDTNVFGADIFLRDRQVCMIPVCPVPNL